MEYLQYTSASDLHQLVIGVVADCDGGPDVKMGDKERQIVQTHLLESPSLLPRQLVRRDVPPPVSRDEGQRTEVLDRCEGKEITTIEGYTETERGKIVTKAFLDEGAVQCGFCTPGMIMSSESILNETEGKPTEYDVRKGLSGNLCRCTGYDHIVSAVLRASDIAFKEGKNLWQ